ncbi:MAG: hypothetical protein ABJB22_06505 [Verrucomicrobiota bacterium]
MRLPLWSDAGVFFNARWPCVAVLVALYCTAFPERVLRAQGVEVEAASGQTQDDFSAPNSSLLQPDPDLEPSLPLPEGPQVITSPDQEVREVSSMPRRFRYQLKVNLRGVYDDNVTLSHDNPRQDFYGQLASEITLGFGDAIGHQEHYVLLKYSPSAYFFVDNSELNSVEHIVRLEGQWSLSRLALTFSQDIRSVESSNLDVATTTGGFVNQINLDVGGRRRLNSYSTRLDAGYALTGKIVLRAGMDYSLTDYQDLIGSETVSGTIGINYTYSPKLQLGLELHAGNNYVDAPSPDQTFEQVNLRSDYELSGKLRANGSLGVEFRQSEVGTNSNVSPIFQIGLVYQPFDGTEININTTRQTFNSATLAGQDFASTQFVFSARQRFFQRVFVNVVTGYQNQTYFSALSGLDSEREDNYYFITLGFDVKITNFWFGGVNFSHRVNDSSFTNLGFDDDQVGAHSAFTF